MLRPTMKSNDHSFGFSAFWLLGILAFWHLSSAFAGVTIGTLTLEREVRPGETYQGSLMLTNNDNEPQDVVIYQTDYSFASDGSNQFGKPGTQPRSNAGWITFSPRQMQIPPHQGSDIHYVVHVPVDSALIGTYWSVIMVEEVPPPDTMIHLARNETTVRQVMRYGVQCVTHIGESGTTKVQVTGARLEELQDNKKELQVDVQNTGERWIVPAAWMELYDSEGHHVGRFDSQKKRIFPGTSVRFHIELNGTYSGKYKALVVLDNGDQNVFGAKYNLEF
jgi:P pilus assembly chaperone PapD